GKTTASIGPPPSPAPRSILLCLSTFKTPLMTRSERCPIALEKGGRKLRISGRLFQKSDGNSQFPDRFGKSCPAIGKAGRNSKKLSNICEMSDGNLKFQPEIRNFQTAFWIAVRLSPKLSGISKSQPTFEKAGQ